MNINIADLQNNIEIKLKRKLNNDEKNIIEYSFDEKDKNNIIDIINSNIKIKKLQISYLTNYFNGDTLFESLVFLNIGNNVYNLKTSISYLMYIFRNYPNFAYNSSLQDIFNFYYPNNIVKYNFDNKYYKYTYKLMCMNMCNNNLKFNNDINIILIFISKFLNLKIKVIYENNFEYNIELCDDCPNDLINLCIIGNNHVLPLKEKIENKNILQYNYYNNKLTSLINNVK